jgi:hypothetical protein
MTTTRFRTNSEDRRLKAREFAQQSPILDGKVRALAASSIYDRIGFAPTCSLKPDSFLLSREKRSKVALLRSAGHFL